MAQIPQKGNLCHMFFESTVVTCRYARSMTAMV